MRPDPGGDASSSSAHSRSRKGSCADVPIPPASAAPTTFFMAREEDVLGGAAKSSRRSSASGRSVKSEAWHKHGAHEDEGGELPSVGGALQDSEYGVQSLEDALGQAFPPDEGEEEAGEEAVAARLLRRQKRRAAGADGTVSMDNSRHQSPKLPHLSTPQSARGPPLSQPLTPLQLESPFQYSTPKSGSFRSLRLSDEEESVTDSGSQAITSGGEEDEDVYQGEGGFDQSGAAPELVMPSLSLPSRRPFTAKGKGMGRVKVLLAGPGGTGKTSLIRAIVQQCPDIVHMDPTTSLPTFLATPRPHSRGKKADRSATRHITELYASTRAYPAWWSELEDSKAVLRRRKSMGDTVLERNVCFVDTPGGNADGVVRYVEGLLHKCSDLGVMSDGEILGVLSGDGGCQVDVCLFLFPDDWKAEDIEYCRRLSQLTNIIPVIGKADVLDAEGYTTRKQDLLQHLEAAGVQSFLFGIHSLPRTSISSQTTITDPPWSMTTTKSNPPYAISTLPSTQDVEMDASLLMSSSYNLPLLQSDLQDLISTLFEPETIAWLRHSAIRKFLLWRERRSSAGGVTSTGLGIREHIALASSNNHHLQQQRHPNSNSSSSLLSTPTASRVLVSRHQNHNAITSPFNLSSSALGHGLNDFTRARLRDHVAAEERLAQVQLARWAAELQRSLRDERRAFEELAQGHRAAWLLERIGEEVHDGKIDVVNRSKKLQVAGWARKESKRRGIREMELPSWARSGPDGDGGGDVGLMWRDPLGLCGLSDGVAKGLGVCVKILGGGVVVGAMVMAVGRAWGVDSAWLRG